VKTAPLILVEASGTEVRIKSAITDLDYFAGQALIAMQGKVWGTWEELAVSSYNLAEAMLAERERRQEGSKERER